MDACEIFLDGKPISEFKVIELKKELELRSLSRSGNKKELYERLKEHLQKNPHEAQFLPQTTKTEETATVNPVVAQYLATQQEVLKAARRDADLVLSGSSQSIETEKSVEIESQEQDTQASVVGMESKHESDLQTTTEEKVESADEADKNIKRGVDDFSGLTGKISDSQNLVREVQESNKFETTESKEALQDEEISSKHNAGKSVEEAIAVKSDLTQQQPKVQSTNEVEKVFEVQEQGMDFVEMVSEVQDSKISEVQESIEIGAEEKDNTTVCSNKSQPSTKLLIPQLSSKSEKTGLDDELDYEDECQEDEDSDTDNKRRRKIMKFSSPSPKPPTSSNEEAVQVTNENIVLSVTTTADSSQPPIQEITPEGFLRKKAVSPARNPVTRWVHIRGLKRPFTHKSLINMLSTFGEVSESNFWIDSIKSNCIVEYSSEEGATLARERLHNCVWPQSSDNSLCVEFSTEEKLKRRKDDDVRFTSNNEKLTVVVENRSKDKDEQLTVTVKNSSEAEPSRKRNADGQLKPQKTLEDLFRKTKTQPSIYFLPLTEEQIAKAQREKSRKAASRSSHSHAIHSSHSSSHKSAVSGSRRK